MHIFVPEQQNAPEIGLNLENWSRGHQLFKNTKSQNHQNIEKVHNIVPIFFIHMHIFVPEQQNPQNLRNRYFDDFDIFLVAARPIFQI